MSWMLTPAVVLCFLLITLYLGIRAASGHQRSVSEHVVAGRGLPLVLVRSTGANRQDGHFRRRQC